MNCIGVQGITALDFHLSMSSRLSPEDCRGPLVYLDLSDEVTNRVAFALATVDKVHLLHRAVVGATDKGEARCGSCVAHWLDISAITSVVGQSLQRRDLHLVANIMMKQVCSTVGWDYRELSNFLASKASNKTE